jgi:hypothetical protein
MAAYPMPWCPSGLPYTDFRLTNIKANLLCVAKHQVINDKIGTSKTAKEESLHCLVLLMKDRTFQILFHTEAKISLHPDRLSCHYND